MHKKTSPQAGEHLFFLSFFVGPLSTAAAASTSKKGTQRNQITVMVMAIITVVQVRLQDSCSQLQ